MQGVSEPEKRKVNMILLCMSLFDGYTSAHRLTILQVTQNIYSNI